MIQPNASSKGRVFFTNLDGIRTIAFLLVFITHAFVTWVPNFNPYQNVLTRVINLVVNAGGLGVTMFFVLSGFLITYLLYHEIQNTGKVSIPHFYLRRVLRIWPLYFALLLFLFVFYNAYLYFTGQPLLVNKVLYYITFLSNIDVIRVHKLSTATGVRHNVMPGITWSVAIEEQFYLIWPILFFLIDRKSSKYIFPVIILLTLVFRYFYRDDITVLYFHSVTAFGCLALGGACAYYAYYSSRFINFFRGLPKLAILLVYALLPVWLLYATQTKHADTANIYFWIVTSLFFAFVILEQNFSEHSFYKFSNFRLLSRWGKYTYGLYLLHEVAINFVEYLGEVLFSASARKSYVVIVAEWVLSFVLSLIIAYISYEFFEQRFLRLKNRFSFVRTRAD